MKYSFLLSPARQATPRLELRHGHINHPTQPWDESKLEINVLQGLTAAQRGMLERGCGNGGSQCRDTFPMLLTRQGKGLQPQTQSVRAQGSGHVRPHRGAPEIQAAGKGPQLLLHREWFGVRARGHPVLPGPAASVASPRRAVGGSVSRWDRRRGAIAAWHAN